MEPLIDFSGSVWLKISGYSLRISPTDSSLVSVRITALSSTFVNFQIKVVNMENPPGKSFLNSFFSFLLSLNQRLFYSLDKCGYRFGAHWLMLRCHVYREAYVWTDVHLQTYHCGPSYRNIINLLASSLCQYSGLQLCRLAWKNLEWVESFTGFTNRVNLFHHAERNSHQLRSQLLIIFCRVCESSDLFVLCLREPLTDLLSS